MKKILITGGRGRIGTDIKEFLEKDYIIIEIKKGDILSEKIFRVDAVIHLAALTPRKDKEFPLKEYIEVNVELTKKILFYASKQNVKTVIIPTSWSWAFKIGNYQYSKLLQEKIANKYKEIGLNVITIELPEVINKGYKGIIEILTERIKNNQETTVDMVNISTITTKDIASIFREFIVGNNKKACDLKKKSIETFNLFEIIQEIIKKDFPEKLDYLKKGKNKLKTPIIKNNKTIIFPDFEIEKRGQ
jgi:nucleoside-diphosphate-sugar epimerase